MSQAAKESWDVGEGYELYVGRWSRLVAETFLHRLSPPVRAAWADIGCGTGALSQRILAAYDPVSVDGIDRSDAFIAAARRATDDPRARFQTGDATALPWQPNSFDLAVSGLVLNFVPDHAAVVREMARVTQPGGTVAVYVWDYAGGMQMMRHFWDAAIAVSPHDAKLDQAERFPICQPEPLAALFRSAGLGQVDVQPIDIPTRFRDFDDYWTPFLGKQGAAPTYLASVSDETRARIRAEVRQRLPTAPDGTIALTARAWAARGVV